MTARLRHSILFLFMLILNYGLVQVKFVKGTTHTKISWFFVSLRFIVKCKINYFSCISIRMLVKLNPLWAKWLIIEPALISGFCNGKPMRVFWLPLDGLLTHRRLAPSRCWYSFTYRMQTTTNQHINHFLPHHSHNPSEKKIFEAWWFCYRALVKTTTCLLVVLCWRLQQ